MEYPDFLYRIDDGEKFIRNADGTYSMEWTVRNFPDNHHGRWSYEEMMKTGVFSHEKPKIISEQLDNEDQIEYLVVTMKQENEDEPLQLF